MTTPNLNQDDYNTLRELLRANRDLSVEGLLVYMGKAYKDEINSVYSKRAMSIVDFTPEMNRIYDGIISVLQKRVTEIEAIENLETDLEEALDAALI